MFIGVGFFFGRFFFKVLFILQDGIVVNRFNGIYFVVFYIYFLE